MPARYLKRRARWLYAKNAQNPVLYTKAKCERGTSSSARAACENVQEMHIIMSCMRKQNANAKLQTAHALAVKMCKKCT